MPIYTPSRRGFGTSEDSVVYWEEFRRKVFRLLMMGYKRLEIRHYSHSEEPDITGELVRGIRDVIDDPLSPDWTLPFSPHDDPPVNAENRLGKNRKKVDIEFESTTCRPHPRYCFEAKRFSGKVCSARQYCGESGMMEFIAGNYAADRHEAGMLGYVQTDSEDIWATKLSEAITAKRGMLKLTTNGSWKRISVIAEISHSYRTEHKRPSIGKDIKLYHILLSFC